MNLSTTSFMKPVVALSLSLSLFACGGDKGAEQPQDKDQATEQTQAASGALKIATTQDFPPFSYLDDKGNLVGFDVDVINAIAKSKGFTVEFQPTTFERIFTDIDNKTSDIGVSGIYYKEDRASKYGLTKPYHVDHPVYFYRADNEKLAKASLSSLSDLNNYTLNIAVVGGIDGLNAQHNVEPVKSEFAGFTGVLQGKYDVAFSDDSVLKYFIKSHPNAAQVQLKTVEYQGEVGYVMVVNKENLELLQKLNDGISELTQNGEMAQIKSKYGFSQ